MNNNEKKHFLLIKHFQEYPLMQIQDVFKFLHHSAFGCEHLVSSEEKAVEYIKEEYSKGVVQSKVFVEKLDGDYSRVHLSCMDYGVSAEVLGKMLFLSAKKEVDGKTKLKQKLKIAEEMITEGLLPFDIDEFRCAAQIWEKEGFPAVHHSEVFRRAYKPAYRVVSDKYAEQISELIKQKMI